MKNIIIIISLFFFTCDKNIFQILDCMGEIEAINCTNPLTTGCAYYNDCGICVGGTSTNPDDPCDCPNNFSASESQSTLDEITCFPNEFIFNISTLSAGYVFSTVSIGGNPVQSSECYDVNDCDWVGVFNGNVCVGATQWNTDDCLSQTCSINAMGFDGFDDGYLEAGEYPTFKIYDVSENIYYNAIASEEHAWYPQGTYIISVLEVEGCMDQTAENYEPNATVNCVDDDSDGNGDCCVYTQG